jgi:hypothetical protein
MIDISIHATYARHKTHALLREKPNVQQEHQDSLQKHKTEAQRKKISQTTHRNTKRQTAHQYSY